MFRGDWESESGWKDLPTQLIRAVGRMIYFEPWMETTVRQLCNGDKVTGHTLYGLLLRHLDYCKQVWEVPLELSLAVPLNFSVESLAKILVRIAILIKDGDRPARDRRNPEQLAQHPRDLYGLLCILDIFLCGVEQYLNSGEQVGTFYHDIAYQLLMSMEDVYSSDQVRVVQVSGLDLDPASLGNFEAAFICEVREAVKAGEELSDKKVQQMADRAAALASLITHSPQPRNPRAN